MKNRDEPRDQAVFTRLIKQILIKIHFRSQGNVLLFEMQLDCIPESKEMLLSFFVRDVILYCSNRTVKAYAQHLTERIKED